MNAVTTKPPPQHTFTLTVDVDPFWVEYVTRCSDIYGRSYAGYWLRAVAFSKSSVLCWEDDEQYRSGEEPGRQEVIELWTINEDAALPKGWHVVNRAVALRAWEEGVKMWGVDWYNATDATREDVVIQLSLLGEVRYG